MLIQAMLFGCSHGVGDALDTPPSGDSPTEWQWGNATIETDIAANGADTDDFLYGVPPSAERPAIDFVAKNRDGTTRGKPDLLGHPTVLWFFVEAATGG